MQKGARVSKSEHWCSGHKRLGSSHGTIERQTDLGKPFGRLFLLKRNSSSAVYSMHVSVSSVEQSYSCLPEALTLPRQP